MKPVDVLLVEDDQGDIDLTREAFISGKLSVNLHIVMDGESAMSFLLRKVPYDNVARPDLILLDLNLPRKNGREVLRDIKTNETLKNIPIIILTTSNCEDDITKSYKLGTNCYITKPIGFELFVKAISVMEEFWFSVVKLPRKDHHE